MCNEIKEIIEKKGKIYESKREKKQKDFRISFSLFTIIMIKTSVTDPL